MLDSGYTKQNPNQNVSRNDGRQGKGDADPVKVAVGYFVSILTKDTDAGDVGGSADGGAIAAQGSTGQQTKIKGGGIYAHFSGDARNDGDHGGNIGDVVDEGGDQHGSPDDDGVHQEGTAGTQLCQKLRQSINDTLVGDAAADRDHLGLEDINNINRQNISSYIRELRDRNLAPTSIIRNATISADMYSKRP